jgi:hypothetical protein
MKPIDAALSAFYPVIVILGSLILLRFAPLLRSVESNTRPLICSQLIVTLGVMWEQILYGFGRFTGTYLTIATAPHLVGTGKIVLAAGFAYQLYAFWLLSTVRPRLAVSFAFTFMLWAVITVMLIF